MSRADSPPRLTDGGPGVSRFDLSCDRQWEEDSTALIRRWGHDRALSAPVVEDLCLVTCTALAHGVRLGPSSACVRLRWVDPDHVRVDVEWQGLGDAPSDEAAEHSWRAAARVMDTVAVRWGVDDGSTPGQWMVVDTRPAPSGRVPPAR